MLPVSECRDLADRLAELDYSVDAVVALIGEPAHRALARNATVPAVRALAGHDDPLATLTRLWLLQRPVDEAAVRGALGRSFAPLVGAGILERDGDTVTAAVDLRPYASDDGAGGWIFSDLTPHLDAVIGPMRPDFVLGVSSASSTLAQLTLRAPVGDALDLGTGCGVQSLHLSQHAERIVATDLNPRALELARLTARINAVEFDLRLGDLYAPVEDARFDLIVTNPPYVMSPPRTDGERLAYREGSLVGDGLVERVVREGVQHLNEGGFLQVLGNWAHLRGTPWDERLAGWLAGTGCDAHVVQREVLEPSAYVELWLADAGLTGSPDYRSRYDEWLDYFDRLGIEAVGLGWLTLRRSDRGDPWQRIEDWPHPVEQPIAPALAAEFAAVARASEQTDAALLAGRWTLALDVIEQTEGRPGAADPEHLIFRQQRGFRRATALDTASAAILGVCDGELDLATIITAVARLLEVDAAALSRESLPKVREWLIEGYLY